MTRALRLAALAACAASATGCYSIRYHTRAAPEPAPVYDKWHHTNVFGLVESSGPVKVGELCPHGVAVVENEDSAGNRFASWFSMWWVWQPTTVRVTCAREAQPRPGAQAPASDKEKKALKVVVLKLAAKGGIAPATVDILTDALVGELRKHAGFSVVSPSEIVTLIGFEREKQLLGCADSGCLAEIAGAMGADRLVSGSIGRLGGSTMVTITALDARKAQAVSNVYETLPTGDDEALLGGMPAWAKRLAAEAAATGP